MKNNKIKINIWIIFILFISLVFVYFISFYYSYNIFYISSNDDKKLILNEKDILDFYSFNFPPDFIFRDDKFGEQQSKISIDNLDEFFEKTIINKGIKNMWESTSKDNWVIRSDPLTPNDWYIVGAVSNSNYSNIFISKNGEKIPFSVSLEQRLPDGSTLKAVKKESIIVLTTENSLIQIPIFD